VAKHASSIYSTNTVQYGDTGAAAPSYSTVVVIVYRTEQTYLHYHGGREIYSSIFWHIMSAGCSEKFLLVYSGISCLLAAVRECSHRTEQTYVQYATTSQCAVYSRLRRHRCHHPQLLVGAILAHAASVIIVAIIHVWVINNPLDNQLIVVIILHPIIVAVFAFALGIIIHR
jgi:hypothetical protein